MTDILDRMVEVLSENNIDNKKVVYIEKLLRNEFSGSLVYVMKKRREYYCSVVEDIKKSNDFIGIARKYSISLNTVYRIAREHRKKQ